MQAAEIITALFGAGGLASLGLVFKAMQARKDGFNRARQEHIEDLAKWRSELQEQVQELTQVVELYRRRAASFEYQLRREGIEPVFPPGDDTPSRGIPAVRS
ncbi:hypothetical protein [Streptomyces sp. NPDC059708]|uniref:hypothetical protein n=1 Tax=Streptomyces sp. NPDC059708 TaxID=3346916 RepID=UPI0036AB3387